MNKQKFVQMIREFPFINKIITERDLSADTIGYIEVKRGDRNLLEVTPCAWAHDAGEFGSHEGYRSFWHITPGEVGQFKASWHRSIVPHGTKAEEVTSTIGTQLLSLDRDILFIVEIHSEGWDGDDKTPTMVIYKMQGFNWRAFVRPTQAVHC